MLSRKSAEFMFKGPLEAKREEIQCNYFTIWIGEKGCQIYRTWMLTADEQKKLKTKLHFNLCITQFIITQFWI